MKLSDYSKITALASDNIFLVDTVNGTRTITAEALLKAISDTFSPKDIFEKIDLSTISSTIGLEDDDLVFLGRAGGNKTMNAKEFLKTLQLDLTKLTEAEQINLTDKLLINDGTGNKSINVENLLKTLNFNVLTEVQEFAEDDNLIVSSPTEGNRIIPASQVGTKLDLNALPMAETATDSDLILLGTSEGNKSIQNKALIGNVLIDYDILDEFIAPEARSHIYRGKNLGTSFTEEQSARIKDGSFKGFFLGDYWEDTVNNVKWVIADFDYWLNSGNIVNDQHHLVIICGTKGGLGTMQINSSGTTNGGYINMPGIANFLNDVISKIRGFFGTDHIYGIHDLLSNSMTNGYPAGVEWRYPTLQLPNEIMVYGQSIWCAVNTGTVQPQYRTTGVTALSLFNANVSEANKIMIATNLRDVVADNSFAYFNGNGESSKRPVTDTLGYGNIIFGLN